ncbi:hypothetical protein [Streptomyces sp. bgisy154]|uniref:hypothetical protein n=1 Tax=Streptomyces sp. bgisy154 TaxID=3413794 RepID=UPI003D721D4F
MTTDLSALTTAADCWDGMAAEFSKVEARYTKDVHGIRLGETWVGVSATVAGERFDVTLKEFQNAQVEAKAIASLLRDAHAQFVDLRGKLKSARADAVADGMNVSDQGLVSFDTARLSAGERNAYHHDPDGQQDASRRVREWQDLIDKCVESVVDADKGVDVALKAVVVDSDTNDGTINGFNAKATGDMEKYEADEAKDIALRIDAGEATEADYQELQRAFRDNSHDKVFSQTFVGGLGARGTLQLSCNLDGLAHGGDKKNNGRYLDIGHGLATTLATATQDPASGFYKKLRTDMQRAGTEQFSVDGLSSIPDEKVRGYQSLVTLMQQSSGYSGQFLKDTADDIRHAEEAHVGKGNTESLWALRGDFSGEDRSWFANDPLDAVLGIMSQDPATSTDYLDPKHTDNLKYLFKERNWDTVIDGYATPPGGTAIGTPVMAEDGDARVGFSAALEAAATGHPPLKEGQDPWPAMKHNEAQTRVMHDTIELLKPSTGTDAPAPVHMRQPIANALGEYTSDTHEILGGMSGDYVRAAAGEGYFTEDGTTHLAVSPKDLVQVMRGLSEDPDAYGTLHKAESRYIDTQLQAIPDGATSFEHSAPLSKSGAALGAYSAIREDVVNDERMTKYSEADWKSKVAYHVVGGAVTPLYVTTGGVSIAFGDTIQRGVDTWAWDLGNAMKAKADGKANAEIADLYLDANNQMNLMVDSWAEGRGDIDTSTKAGRAEVQVLTDDLLNGHDRGANNAHKYLTDTSN